MWRASARTWEAKFTESLAGPAPQQELLDAVFKPLESGVRYHLLDEADQQAWVLTGPGARQVAGSSRAARVSA